MGNPNHIKNEIITIRRDLNNFMKNHEAGDSNDTFALAFFTSTRSYLVQLFDEDYQQYIGSYPSSLQNRQILSMIDICRHKIESIKQAPIL